MNDPNPLPETSSPSDPSDLIARIKRLSSPLEPLPTDLSPSLESLADIRAVVLDVYGTMFVSASGDIVAAGKAGEAGEAVDQAMIEALEVMEFGLIGREADGSGSASAGRRGVQLMRQAVREHHERERARGVDYPEVEIRDIWRQLVDGLIEGGLIAGRGISEVVSDRIIEALAVEYECRVNPVWPMPGLEETLAQLSGGGLMLGIVSNSQFCTSLMFDALLGRSVEELGFLSDLCAWSYARRCAKPSTGLYEPVKVRLADRGLDPQQVLYVGNDMRKDIWPAGRLGFRTALFAGDRRSLRLEAAEAPYEARPTVTITQLSQLLEVI